MPLANDYTVQLMVNRITLKAFTSSSSSLSPQQIVDLCNDSLRSYIVPLTQTLREEWWVGKTDIIVTTDANGMVTLPDSVASTLRTVAWNNGGLLSPLTRIEPELSFQYLAMKGSLPVGFELRGYTLIVLPVVAGLQLNLTAMLRPPQMILDQNAAQVPTPNVLHLNPMTVAAVPLAWQAATPAAVDIISATSPFSVLQSTVQVASIVGNVVTFTVDPTFIPDINVALNGLWLADLGGSPFANLPVELHPLLEQDVVCTLFQMFGDKRLKGALDRKKELEEMAKRTLGPRTSGNSRPIVNPNAPGMRSMMGFWRR